MGKQIFFYLQFIADFRTVPWYKNLHYSQVVDRGVQFRKQLIHFLSRMTYAVGHASSSFFVSILKIIKCDLQWAKLNL